VQVEGRWGGGRPAAGGNIAVCTTISLPPTWRVEAQRLADHGGHVGEALLQVGGAQGRVAAEGVHLLHGGR
jgi:hypothetical protein